MEVSCPTLAMAEVPDTLCTDPVLRAPGSTEKKGSKHASVPRPSVPNKQDIASSKHSTSKRMEPTTPLVPSTSKSVTSKTVLLPERCHASYMVSVLLKASSLVLSALTRVDLPEQHIFSVLTMVLSPALQSHLVPHEFRFSRDLLVLEELKSPLLVFRGYRHQDKHSH